MSISSREKKLMIGSVIAIALPFGVVLFWNHINATPVVKIPPYPSAPNPNGYDLYVASATAIIPAVPRVDAVNDAKPPTDPKIRAQRYSLARKTAWLNTNAKAFAIFDQAMKTPTLSPPDRSSTMLFPSYAQLRELARCKTTESNARWMRKDYYGALSSGLDTIQLGHDMRRGGALIADLVGIAIGAIGRSVTHDTVEHLDATQAKNASRRIEKMLANRWNLDQVLTEAKYSAQARIMEVFQSPAKDWRGAFFDSNSPPTLAERVRCYTISKQEILDNIEADYDRQIVNARVPFLQKGTPPTKFNDPFTKLFLGSTRIRANDARDLAGDRLLMLNLALHAYQLEHGAYPLALKDLTPQYLKTIPADPFGNGEAMHYKSDGKTQTLWSIGPDEKDDGGTPIPSRNARPSSTPSPDGRVRLPSVLFDSKGDIVAGKNR